MTRTKETQHLPESLNLNFGFASTGYMIQGRLLNFFNSHFLIYKYGKMTISIQACGKVNNKLALME